MTRAFTIAAFLAFMIDQIFKYVVIHMMELSRIRSIDVFPPWLNFRYGENCGINFGIFGGCSELSRWTLIILGIVVCCGIAFWLHRSRQPFRAQVSGGLLIGGALANVVDRLIYGYVLDMLNNGLPNWSNPFVYNVADIFIFAGGIGLVLFSKDKNPRTARQSKKRP